MSTYDLIADLPLQIDELRARGAVEADVSSGFPRRSTTVIRLRGGGHEGLGEDVTYDADDHDALQDAGPGRCRSRAPGRSARSASTSRRSTCGPSRPAAPPRGSTASGRTSRPRSTSRCARPGTSLHDAARARAAAR